MRFAAVSIVIVTVVAFMAGVLLVDLAVEAYKRYRDRRDRWVPDFKVGSFRGVEETKKW